MEQAPLDPRIRPHGLRGLEDAAPAVAHEHVGRRDARHQALPCRRFLAFGDVPADHVPAGHRDQDHRVAVQVDAVHMHHMSSHRRRSVRAGSRCSACDCFENSQSRPHRRSRALLSRDWVRELPQPAFRHRHLIRPRARPSVPLHRLAAHGATRCVHPPNLPRQLESHSTVVPQGLTGHSGHTFWPTSSSPPIQLEQEERPPPQRNTSQNGHTFWPITR